MTFEEVGSMPMAGIDAYLTRLPARMAEVKLMLADVVILPNIKDHQRNAAIRSWRREIEKYEPAQPVSPARLRMLGIGVRYVQ